MWILPKRNKTTLCYLVNNWKESNLPQKTRLIACCITDHAIVLIMLYDLHGFMSALEKNVNDYVGISTSCKLYALGLNC